MRIRKRDRSVPELNTASLPDLIFTVLFFFMIVTHLRTEEVKVKYTVPQGTELTKTGSKSATVNIHIGLTDGGVEGIQLNGRLVSPEDIRTYMKDAQKKMSSEDRKKFTVAIKADRKTKMATVNAVKEALRQAGVKHISYSATEGAAASQTH